MGGEPQVEWSKTQGRGDAVAAIGEAHVFPPEGSANRPCAGGGPGSAAGLRGTALPAFGVFSMSFHAAPSVAAAIPAENLAGLDAEVRRLGRLLPDDRAMRAPEPAGKPVRAGSGLVAWRLKRVLAFMEEHYGEPVTLAEMARVAGLSRMHFAAKFRISTGSRPHEYLLRLRVERAQTLMLETCEPLAQVAFSVGFQTQAHFTTVFRRFAATTPHRWRSEQMARAPGGGAAAPRALGAAQQA